MKGISKLTADHPWQSVSGDQFGDYAEIAVVFAVRHDDVARLTFDGCRDKTRLPRIAATVPDEVTAAGVIDLPPKRPGARRVSANLRAKHLGAAGGRDPECVSRL